MDQGENMTNKLTGTTAPIFISEHKPSQTIQSGKNYFYIQIHGAQAAYFGPAWQKTEGMVVLSQIDLNYPPFNQASKTIQRTRKVERNHAEQLGLNTNLVGLVPASMGQISISFNFLLDRKNQLVGLSKVINNNSLLFTITLAPAAALVVQTLSILTEQLIANFIPADDHIPLLQFDGNFNFSGEGTRSGYYVILGTKDEANPLPSSSYAKYTIQDHKLFLNDMAVTQLSYIILDVRCVPVRTRELNENAVWNMKLREAEDEARSRSYDPFSTQIDRKQSWKKCTQLLREAQALLRNDPNYLREEAEQIIRSVYKECEELCLMKPDGRTKGEAVPNEDWTSIIQMDRDLLGIPSNDSDFNQALDRYAEEVYLARKIFKSSP
jgi:hypothetical protein